MFLLPKIRLTDPAFAADWQDGPVPQIRGEFVPMFWGPSKQSQWRARVAEMKKHKPQHLMAFNEPDVQGQANMDPNYAASVYMKEIYPWSQKGVSLGSPAVVWDLDWMDTFLNAVQQKGGHIDFMCLHWYVICVGSFPHSMLRYEGYRYGGWDELARFKQFIQTAHSRFGKNIWITEVGITSASHPSQSQVKSFMVNAFNWLDTQPYVERAAWFGKSTTIHVSKDVVLTSCGFPGAWESNHPPDSYSSKFNALLKPGGALNNMGNWSVIPSLQLG